MAEFFPFKTDHTLIPSENIIWNDTDEPKQFGTVTHSNLNENECFVTPDATEYLSELESTNDIAFGDLHNLVLDNVVENTVEQNEEAADPNQILVFQIDGSDDLYGIQIVQGEDGKMERYQFKFGTNENGELEAIPDTIELLPNEEQERRDEIESNIKQEIFAEAENASGEMMQEENDRLDEEIVEDPEIEDNQLDDIDDSNDRIKIEQELIENNKIEFENVDDSTDMEIRGEEESNYAEYDEVYIENEENENTEGLSDLEAHEAEDLNESEYEMIDSLHVTAESQQIEEPETNTILQTALEQSNNSNVLKQYGSKINADSTNDKVVYYVIQQVQQEKENVNNSLIYKPVKPNPRSILKTSYTMPIVEDTNHYDERLEKRYAKSKEALEARMFHNFITKTTIPQEPVRNVRLPRKQKIKPINERVNEEIIVQEVMVSSNGDIVNMDDSKTRRSNLTVTGYVELSDSDDEKSNKSAETDSDESVIEILNSDDDEVEKTPNKRGRPRKNCENKNDLNGIAKKKKVIGKDLSTSLNNEIKCTTCSKTFPSQNSLNTHMQHHNLENSIMFSKQTRQSTQIFPSKYKCEKCGTTFKNTFLMNKHKCDQTNKLQCPACHLKFADFTTLNIHKRMHAKENLLKLTSNLRISPSKRPSDNTKSEAKNVFKCTDCCKNFSSKELLKSHSSIHKKFSCSNCPKTFSSRILLDTHIRENCVKYKSPQNRRLSFKTKRFTLNKSRPSFMKSASTTLDTSTASTPSSTKKSLINLSCSQCSSKFTTHKDLFKHRVLQHGLNTPDKNVLAKPRQSLYKQIPSHGGIPVNDKLKRAYAGLKDKLELSQIV